MKRKVNDVHPAGPANHRPGERGRHEADARMKGECDETRQEGQVNRRLQSALPRLGGGDGFDLAGSGH